MKYDTLILSYSKFCFLTYAGDEWQVLQLLLDSVEQEEWNNERQDCEIEQDPKH